MILADDSGSPDPASNTLPCENAGKNKLIKKINAKTRFIKEAPIYETIGKVNCYITHEEDRSLKFHAANAKFKNGATSTFIRLRSPPRCVHCVKLTLRFFLTHQICFYKSIQFSIHHRLHISHFII